MIHRIYEKLLMRDILEKPSPQCIAVVLDIGDLDGQGLHLVKKLIDWCRDVNVTCVMLHIAMEGDELKDQLASEMADCNADISVYSKDGILQTGTGGINVIISLGYGGKKEVTDAIRSILEDVERNQLNPDQINENMIEKNLRFSQKPDLIIRSGGRQLSDFMIWQAAYSELYFTEVNWRSLRKIDFLRAIRDYQRRGRRYGI